MPLIIQRALFDSIKPPSELASRNIFENRHALFRRVQAVKCHQLISTSFLNISFKPIAISSGSRRNLKKCGADHSDSFCSLVTELFNNSSAYGFNHSRPKPRLKSDPELLLGPPKCFLQKPPSLLTLTVIGISFHQIFFRHP